MSLNRDLPQHTVDAHMRGRIMSIDMMFHGLMPTGVFPAAGLRKFTVLARR